METSSPAWRAAIAGLVIGALFVGFAAGWFARPSAAPPSDAATPTALSGARPEVTTAATPDLADVERLNKKITAQQQVIATLKVAVYGKPMAWPADTPDKFKKPAIQAALEAAEKDCGLSPEVVGWSCDEPPCFAVIRGGLPQLASCPTWRITYCNALSQSTDEVDCGDHTERIVMVSPAWDTLVDADPENVMKRMQARAADAKEGWTCAGAAR